MSVHILFRHSPLSPPIKYLFLFNFIQILILKGFMRVHILFRHSPLSPIIKETRGLLERVIILTGHCVGTGYMLLQRVERLWVERVPFLPDRVGAYYE